MCVYEGLDIVYGHHPYQMMLRVNTFCTNNKRWEAIGCLNRLPKNAFNYFVLSLPVMILQ
jgi:hypothetical protein